MSNLFVRETYVNADKGHVIVENKVEETTFLTTGAMFRYYRRQAGQCIGYVYRDNPDSPHKPDRIGWVFRKRVLYSGAKKRPYYNNKGMFTHYAYRPSDYYMQELWVEVHTALPTVVTTEYVKVF